MSENSRINLKIGQIEISIEGPAEFVSKQYDKVEAHLKTYSEISAKIPEASQNDKNNPSSGNPDVNAQGTNNGSSGLPVTFGEWLNLVPNDTSDTSKAILAGFFTQTTSPAKNFRVRDVSKLLKEHGIKLSNTSTFLKNAVNNKSIFQVSKTGTEAHYKLTREAEAEMTQLLKGNN